MEGVGAVLVEGTEDYLYFVFVQVRNFVSHEPFFVVVEEAPLGQE